MAAPPAEHPLRDSTAQLGAADLAVRTLGPPRARSPLDPRLLPRAELTRRVLLDVDLDVAAARGLPADQLPAFEAGGARPDLFFDPRSTRAGIVTCGGLCPGLNNVVRGLVDELHGRYGVRSVTGFRDGFRGLTRQAAGSAVPLTAESVRGIDSRGGTVLGTSRGWHDPAELLDTLLDLDLQVLFVIGGDGSLRGAQCLADEAAARGAELAVVCLPKTIDNDIRWVDQSFGFQTAYARAAESIRAAATEARSTPNGVGLIKLMGRHSGFIAAYGTLASEDVDLVLVPEVRFALDGPRGVLPFLTDTVTRRGHAVVVAAEGAGQDLFPPHPVTRDASGNVRLSDIGALLRDRITAHMAELGLELNLRYVDPGYAIRSVPANAQDSVYCARLAQAAVHAAMAGRTAVVVGRWHGRFVHVPIALATAGLNRIDPDGDLWASVLEATGQPVP